MRKIVPILMVFILFLTGCSSAHAGDGKTMTYTQITQEQAKEMMAKDDGHVVVDVRRQDEYDSGHIPGAILIPNESIGCDSPEELPDYDQIILIYCRSGNRSKQAAGKLAGMGYTHIYEFGGINTWTGEIVTEDAVKEDEVQTVTISIESNPTTGFSWEAVQEPELFLIQDEYTADPQDAPVDGAGGVQKFTLTPMKPGRVHVTFTYLRPWEPNDRDALFTAVFKIDEDMKITVVDDGAEAANEYGYDPVIRVIGEETPECEEQTMKIKVTDGTNTIFYELNDTPPAQSLYAMLPFDIEVENYGSNEKIFYPIEKLATEGGIEGDGEAGDLALFSPWGNVVMFYDRFSSYPGLYILGNAFEGTDQVKNLSGTIHLEAVE